MLTGLLIGLVWYREAALLAAYPKALAPGQTHLIRYGDMVIVGLLQWLKFGVLSMMTLLIASFSNTNLFSVVMGFFVLVICHLQYLAHQAYAKLEATSILLRILIETLARVFPNFQLFNLADHIGADTGIDSLLALRVAGYAVIYIFVFGGLAVYSFRHREI